MRGLMHLAHKVVAQLKGCFGMSAKDHQMANVS